MKRFIVYSLLIFGFFCTGSCKKDKDTQPGGTTLQKIVVRGLSISGDASRTYLYDPQNRLVSATVDNIVLQDSEFKYDQQGRLSTFTAPAVVTYTYTYDNNGRIRKKTALALIPGLIVKDYAYAYDNQNRVIADTLYDQVTNDITRYFTYAYDAAGNIIEKNEFINDLAGSLRLLEKSTYTYDDKPNPYYNIGNAIYFSTQNIAAICRNNLLTTTESLGFGASNTYVYYPNGQAKQQMSKNGRMQGEIITTFYFKKP